MIGMNLSSLLSIVKPAKAAPQTLSVPSARRGRLNWILLLALGGVSAGGEALACNPGTSWQSLQDAFGSTLTMQVLTSTFIPGASVYFGPPPAPPVVSGTANGGTVSITSLDCNTGQLNVQITATAPASGGADTYSTATIPLTIQNFGESGVANNLSLTNTVTFASTSPPAANTYTVTIATLVKTSAVYSLTIVFSDSLSGAKLTVSAEISADGGVVSDLSADPETVGENLAEVADTVTGVIVSELTEGVKNNAKLAGGPAHVVSTGLSPIAGGVRYQGVSAGDGYDFPFALWATYDHTNFDDDTGGTGLDGDTDSLLIGGDFSPWEGTAFGLAVGYEDSQIDTFFNGGDFELEGFSVVPYAALYLSDYVGVDFDLTADFLAGFSSLDLSTTRTLGGATVSGSTESQRRFVAGNLTAGMTMGDLYLSGSGGLLLARDEIDGFVDSSGASIPSQRTSFGQLSLGGEAAYGWGSFEPYVSAQWRYAYEREESTVVSDDANSAQLGLGLRYFGDAFSGGLGYSAILGREDYSQGTLSAQIRADF